MIKYIPILIILFSIDMLGVKTTEIDTAERVKNNRKRTMLGIDFAALYAEAANTVAQNRHAGKSAESVVPISRRIIPNHTIPQNPTRAPFFEPMNLSRRELSKLNRGKTAEKNALEPFNELASIEQQFESTLNIDSAPADNNEKK